MLTMMMVARMEENIDQFMAALTAIDAAKRHRRRLTCRFEGVLTPT